MSKKIARQKCMGECRKELSLEENFYRTNNKLFPNGRVTICKQCIKKMINYDDINTVYDVLRRLDIPYIHEYWMSAEESKNDTFGAYIRMANSLPYFRDKTWADSEFDKGNNEEVRNHKISFDNTVIPSKEFVVTEEIIDKWGVGYSPDEYQQFEKKYKRLINNYGEKTALHTENLLTYIRYRVKEEMATARGDVKEAKEWGTLAAKAAQDAKINVSQLSKSDISGGVDVLSQLFEAVESEVSIIPLLPRLLEQPYDDADLIIWATINYNRRLEDKPTVSYREVWNFYDKMLEEYFEQQGYNEEQIIKFKAKRNNVFRDLERVYIEPLYANEGEN